MAKKQQPKNLTVTTNPGQLSSPGGNFNYLIRTIPLLGNPQIVQASQWRTFVASQEIAVLCRDAIASHLISLDWKIVAADVNQQDELKEEIKHYTKLFERGNTYYYDLDFTSHIEWFVKDLFDLPFGTASEFGRENDEVGGKVLWIRPLDGGTLTPTLNADWPIMQQYPGVPPVFFPRDTVSRAFLSPRTEIKREGWGLAPPERIYLAMEMLNMGDRYYAQLLSNTPEAGILDLGDMDATSATEWVKSFRELLYGINPLKIPVLFEHTSKTEWIPFGKLPSEILYDSVTNKYITIVTAGYGLSPSDIGFASSSNGGETLSGTIRAERRSARSGKAVGEKKFQSYANNILPETLRFKWINQDDEKNVAMSRARMANANAATAWIANKVYTPAELRRQGMADGMFTISMPENPPPETSSEWPTPPTPTGAFGQPANKLNNKIGSPKSPSSGGQGDAIPQQVISRNRALIQTVIAKAVYSGNKVMGELVNSARDNGNVSEWEQDFDNAVLGKSVNSNNPTIDSTVSVIRSSLSTAIWVDSLTDELLRSIIQNEQDGLKASIRDDLMKRAETEYILGSRDDISLTEDEEIKLSTIDLAKDFPQLREQVRRSFLGTLVGTIIFVSKSAILDSKYSLDMNDLSDNNILKLARGVAARVFGLFPTIVNEVYAENVKSIRCDISGELPEDEAINEVQLMKSVPQVEKHTTLDDVQARIMQEIVNQRQELDARELDAQRKKSEVDAEVDRKLQMIGMEKSTQALSSVGELAETLKGVASMRPPDPAPINITAQIQAQLPENPPAPITFSPVIQPSEVVVQNNTPIENKVTVGDTNNTIVVEPTPITNEVNNQITVQPADVTVIQDKPHRAVVTRDADGKISEITTDG